jgi:hypothetical protein
MHGYSAHDDTAMFYKSYLLGVNNVIVANACYQHLDGKTSTKNNMERARFATGFNTVIFWHRFLFGGTFPQKIWSVLCIHYRLATERIYFCINVLRSRMPGRDANAFNSGVRAGWAWIKSKEYQSLPPIQKDDPL